MKQLKWVGNPKIGWWADNEYLYLFHGTHKDNLPAIINSNHILAPKSGPTAGWVSMALEPNTAHGYASMGGESAFRAAGAQARHVPESDRVVIVAKVPMTWIQANMNKEMRGNVNSTRKKLTDKAEFEKFKGSDSEYYALTELRFKDQFPLSFVVGFMKKDNKKLSIDEELITEKKIVEGGVVFLVNPTFAEFERMMSSSSHNLLRASLDRVTGDTFYWDAGTAVHASANRILGISSYSTYGITLAIDPTDPDTVLVMHDGFDEIPFHLLPIYQKHKKFQFTFKNKRLKIIEGSTFFQHRLNPKMKPNLKTVMKFSDDHMREMGFTSEDVAEEVIAEKIEGTFDNHGTDVKYYKNPSQRELDTILQQSRFGLARIAFDGHNGDVYAFDGADSYHYKFYKETGVTADPEYPFSISVRKKSAFYDVVVEFDPMKHYSTLDIAKKHLETNRNFKRMFGFTSTRYMDESKDFSEKYDFKTGIIEEEAPTTNIGSGNIAGSGVKQGDEPAVKRKSLLMGFRRNGHTKRDTTKKDTAEQS